MEDASLTPKPWSLLATKLAQAQQSRRFYEIK